jgi:hypothetical protein
MRPATASSRKQMRQTWNFRMNARGLPHNWQRLYPRTLNFGSLAALILRHFLANARPPLRYFAANGIPSSLSSRRASASVRPVVTIVMSSPWGVVTALGSISGKIACSFTPSV